MLTLQLNISCEPIRLIKWQEAITLWYVGKVDILEEYDSPCRSVYIEMKKPAVVKLTRNYHKHNYEVPLDRWHLFARDAWTCQYCGKRFSSKDLTFDHVVPQSRGGRTNWLNIVAACHSCNQRKANKTPREALMPLLRKPLRPRWMPWLLARTIRLDQVPGEWLDWISWIPRTIGAPLSQRELRC